MTTVLPFLDGTGGWTGLRLAPLSLPAPLAAAGLALRAVRAFQKRVQKPGRADLGVTWAAVEPPADCWRRRPLRALTESSAHSPGRLGFLEGRTLVRPLTPASTCSESSWTVLALPRPPTTKAPPTASATLTFRLLVPEPLPSPHETPYFFMAYSMSRSTTQSGPS